MKPASIFILFLLLSCNRIYEKHYKDFPEYRWPPGLTLEYTPEITDTASRYNLYLSLRHVFGFNYRKMSVRLTTTTPSGNHTVKDYTFDVIGQDDRYLATCAGDICDLEVTVEKNLHFEEPGIYRIEVNQLTTAEPLQSVMEFGVVIIKAEE